MQIQVSGSTPFKVLNEQFSVAPTTSGYQIAYAVKREGPYTLDTEAIVPAEEVLVYLGSQRFGYYMLSGNTDADVAVLL